MPDVDGDNSTLLLEADATANLKLLTDAHVFTPYLTFGVGASEFQHYYGAIIPLGIGIKFNLFNEAAVFLSTEYRVPVTPQTNSFHFVYAFGVAGTIGQKKGTPSVPAM